MSQKSQHLEDGVRLSTLLAQTARDLVEARRVYYHRDYNSAAADEITDQDCIDAGYEFTAAQFGQIMITAQELDKFLNNTDPANADYYEKLDVVRSDK